MLSFGGNQLDGLETELRELRGSQTITTIAEFAIPSDEKGFASIFRAPGGLLDGRGSFLETVDRQLPNTRLRELEEVCDMQDRLPFFSCLELVLIKSSVDRG